MAILACLLSAVPAVQEAEPAAPSEERWYRYGVELFEEGSRDSLYSAYYAFEAFLASYPRSRYATNAKRYMMESAKRLVEVGYPEQILSINIPFTESGRKGAQLLEAALQRFHTETFSPAYHLWLANYYFGRSDWDKAEVEYRTIAERYGASEHAATALYRLGEVALMRFRGVAYDAAPLEEARRRFEQFVAQYPRHDLAAEARAKLQSVGELLAQKWLNDAAFYRRRGLPNSARFMYRAVLRQYPDTAAADSARRALREMGENP